jgi:hypothetical protein
MYYDQQVGFFATPPDYCSSAQGIFNNGTPNADAFDCHVILIPGTLSPDWDVVAYGGSTVGGRTAQTKHVVTGSRSDNTALASVLAALVNMGLVTDNTTE